MHKLHQNSNIPVITKLIKFAKRLKLTSLKEDLEKSNSYLSLALKGAEYGQWNWNMISGGVKLSSNAQSILGYEKKEKKLNYKSYMELVHPEDKSSVLYEIEKHKSGVTDFVCVDIRMQSAYDNWNWINLRGKITKFNKKGIPIKFTGINYDINEQKQFEDDVDALQQEVLKSKVVKNKCDKITTDIETNVYEDIDHYSKFRLNGLRDLLKYN